MYAAVVAVRWLRFLHIPKTAGTSFFADAMFMIPSNMSFLDNGEARLNLAQTASSGVCNIQLLMQHVAGEALRCFVGLEGKVEHAYQVVANLDPRPKLVQI